MVRRVPFLSVTVVVDDRPKVTAERDFADANSLDRSADADIVGFDGFAGLVKVSIQCAGERVDVIGNSIGRPCESAAIVLDFEPEFDLDLDLGDELDDEAEDELEDVLLARTKLASGESCSAPNRTRSLEPAGAVKFRIPMVIGL
jgi:hypothetical protein